MLYVRFNSWWRGNSPHDICKMLCRSRYFNPCYGRILKSGWRWIISHLKTAKMLSVGQEIKTTVFKIVKISPLTTFTLASHCFFPVKDSDSDWCCSALSLKLQMDFVFPLSYQKKNSDMWNWEVWINKTHVQLPIKIWCENYCMPENYCTKYSVVPKN